MTLIEQDRRAKAATAQRARRAAFRKAKNFWQLAEEKWAPTRDRSHVAVMRSGMCLRCFGWVDDPRHTEILFAAPPR